MLPKVVIGTTTIPLGGLDKEPQSTATKKVITDYRFMSGLMVYIYSRLQVKSVPVQDMAMPRQNRVGGDDDNS